MRPSQAPATILTHKRIIKAEEITRIFHGAKITMTILGLIFPITFNLPTINRIFLANFHNLHFKILQLKRN